MAGKHRTRIEEETGISRETRAGWISVTLDAYEAAKGETQGSYTKEELAIDLLADLRHYCSLNDLHYEKLDNMAFQHFENER